MNQVGTYTLGASSAGLTGATSAIFQITPARPDRSPRTDRTKTYGQTVTFAGTEFTTSGLLGAGHGRRASRSRAPGRPRPRRSPAALPDHALGARSAPGSATTRSRYVDGSLTVNPAALTITADEPARSTARPSSSPAPSSRPAAWSTATRSRSVTLTSPGAAATATVAGARTRSRPGARSAPAWATTPSPTSTARLTVNAGRADRSPPTTRPRPTARRSSSPAPSSRLPACSTATRSPASRSTEPGARPRRPPSPAARTRSRRRRRSAPGLANYTISYVNGALTVNAGRADDHGQRPSKTYGQTVTFAGTEFTDSGLVNGDTVTSVTLTSAGAAATATVAGSPTRSRPARGRHRPRQLHDHLRRRRADRNPAALTVTADDQTKTYGQTVTFAGTEFTDHRPAQRRHGHERDPDQRRAAATATVAGCPYAIVAVGRGRHRPRQLHDHLRRRHADGQHGRADDHRQRPRARPTATTVDLRRHRVHDQRPGQRRHGRQRDLASTGHRRRRPPSPAALSHHAVARPSAPASATTRSRYVDGSPDRHAGRADDHGRRREQDLRRHGHLRRHRVHDERPGQRRHGRQRDPDQHRRRGDGHRRRQPVPDHPVGRASGTGLGNYTITYVDGTLTVSKADAVIVVTGYSVTYDALAAHRDRHGNRRPRRGPGRATSTCRRRPTPPSARYTDRLDVHATRPATTTMPRGTSTARSCPLP